MLKQLLLLHICLQIQQLQTWLNYKCIPGASLSAGEMGRKYKKAVASCNKKFCI